VPDRPLGHSASSGCIKKACLTGVCAVDRLEKVHSVQLKHIFKAPRLWWSLSSVIALRFGCIQGMHVACTGFGHCQLYNGGMGCVSRLQNSAQPVQNAACPRLGTWQVLAQECAGSVLHLLPTLQILS